MEITISIVTAYILSGAISVMRDVGASPIDKPSWAVNPTIGKILWFTLIWPFLQIMQTYNATLQIGRSVAFGLLGSFLQTILLSIFVWGCISLATTLADGFLAQIGLTAVFCIVGSVIAAPLANLVMVPLMLVLSWPLEILFPLRKKESLRKKNDTEPMKQNPLRDPEGRTERPSAFDIADAISNANILDVNLVKRILADNCPAVNEMKNDSYADLLADLAHFHVATDWDLCDLLDEQAAYVKKDEAKAVLDTRNAGGYSGDGAKRIKSGVCRSWTGLARTALEGRFGEEWREYIIKHGFLGRARSTNRRDHQNDEE